MEYMKRRKIPTLSRNEYLAQFSGEKVRVYFNLHKKLFSVKSKKTNLVLFHTKSMHLKNVTYKVYESGRQRVLKEKRKNVHAYVDGTISGIEQSLKEFFRVEYNPYKYDSFNIKWLDKPINESKYAHLTGKKIYAW